MQIKDARDGKGKKTGIRRQVNIAQAFSHKCGLPILFRVLPGNIPNVSTIPELFFRFKYFGDVRISTTVLDRGYFSKDNLVRFRALAVTSVACPIRFKERPSRLTWNSAPRTRAGFGCTCSEIAIVLFPMRRSSLRIRLLSRTMDELQR